ncbi:MULTISPECIES: DUF4238 domain-containing protein [unclassified Bradyrhizobium]|uniref:DUF4238 domain-containing protein n=1 Tax=unclassified Bradyrhizobium TaxID=2631580 RepID=UPI002915E94A|nr:MULTISPECIES: DUF4238 domain-containing protein [unclassified Bradyrhizobium]
MPQNKKHHFVPKFYLRNFSGDGKSIGIYNISSQRVISKGNLRNQCYRDYFYGKDLTVEHALAGMEGAAAELINNAILKNEAVPRPFSAEHIILSHFIVLQAARTNYEADAMAESTDKLFKTIYRGQFDDLDQYEIGFEDPVLMSLQVASRMVPAVYDLKIKLLRNNSGLGLITSDNPIVRHNQHFEGNERAGHTGLGQAGLQIFLPLSPKYLILLYDAQTYKVGEKNCRVVTISSSDDVVALNELQWLNAHENVYFSEGEEASVHAQALRVVRRRRDEKSSVKEHPLVDREPDPEPETTRGLLHEFRPGLDVRLRGGFMKIRRRPKHQRHDFRPAPERDSDYSDLVEEFGRLLAAKKVAPEDFFAFAAKHRPATQR